MLAVQMREPLTERALEAIRMPALCLVGIWLVSKHTLHLRGIPEYCAAVDLHGAFHCQMQQVANLLQTGDYPQTLRLLNAPGPFQSTSNSFANAIMALDRRILLRPAPRKTSPEQINCRPALLRIESSAALECVAGGDGSLLHSLAEPVNALGGAAVGEGLRADRTALHLLQMIVADRGCRT